MRIGLLSDIHGNPWALKRCLTVLDSQKAAKYFFLGDTVGYIPGEQEVFDILEGLDAQCLRGNHEEMFLTPTPTSLEREEVYQLSQARARTSAARLANIETWPTRFELENETSKILMVHGSPRNELFEYIYPDSDITWMESLPFSVVFMGHTHRPFMKRMGTKLIVNVGSVGLPRDQGNMAACALYDSRSNECRILRVQFDTEQVINAYRTLLSPDVISTFARMDSGIFGEICG